MTGRDTIDEEEETASDAGLEDEGEDEAEAEKAISSKVATKALKAAGVKADSKPSAAPAVKKKTVKPIPRADEVLFRLPEGTETSARAVFRAYKRSIANYFKDHTPDFEEGANHIRRLARIMASNTPGFLGSLSKDFSATDPVSLARRFELTSMNHHSNVKATLEKLRKFQELYSACVTLFGKEAMDGIGVAEIPGMSAISMRPADAMSIFQQTLKPRGKPSKDIAALKKGVREKAGQHANVVKITSEMVETHHRIMQESGWRPQMPQPKHRRGRGISERMQTVSEGVMRVLQENPGGIKNSGELQASLNASPMQVYTALSRLADGEKVTRSGTGSAVTYKLVNDPAKGS